MSAGRRGRTTERFASRQGTWLGVWLQLESFGPQGWGAMVSLPFGRSYVHYGFWFNGDASAPRWLLHLVLAPNGGRGRWEANVRNAHKRRTIVPSEQSAPTEKANVIAPPPLIFATALGLGLLAWRGDRRPIPPLHSGVLVRRRVVRAVVRCRWVGPVRIAQSQDARRSG